VSEISACQQANGDGYAGGVPGSKAFWAEIASGKIDAMKKKWVPWYNVHKTFAGLRDAWLCAGNSEAREAFLRLCDWAGSIVRNLSDAQMEQMMGTEYGGMNEVLADAYALTGDGKYLALARRFDHQAILAPLAAGQDKLDGLHANTQIPKIIGFERIAELSDDPADAPLARASRFFWKTVTTRRSVSIGGNSVGEHFQPAANFSSMIERREGPETCNSYNMLKLSQDLFGHDPENRAAYTDFIERTLFNHILSTVDPQGFVYFTPMRPGHYRTYGTAGESFWCCVGTGMENHGKDGGYIYSRASDGQGAYVNLFIASTLDWKEKQVRVRQETRFPDEPSTRLALSLPSPTAFTLYLRHPAWIDKGDFRVLVNGAPLPEAADSAPSSYLPVKRTWSDGDVVEIALPMKPRCERLPDGSPWFSFLYGPLVLAATMGTDDMPDLRAGAGRWDNVAQKGALLPLADAPTLVCEPGRLEKIVVPVPGEPLAFTLGNFLAAEKYRGLKLVPFYRLDACRYTIYLRQVSPGDYQNELLQVRAAQAEKEAIDARTVDVVHPGEQQPESDHGFAGEKTASGFAHGLHSRSAQGWFSYDLKAGGGKTLFLTFTVWSSDAPGDFRITANGVPLDVPPPGSAAAPSFQTLSIPVPESVLSQSMDGALTVRFEAGERGPVRPIYDVRLLGPKPAPAP
ncbi:MAG TPA: beta-L-arabinofuranosidase domain-containing protein, partial [Candidatus Methylacidiphilales bacterium]